MKINFLYILITSAILGIVTILVNLNKEVQNTYFGTTEASNKIINLNFEAIIKRLYISNGQYVHKGDTLFTFSQSDLEKKLNEYQANIENLITTNNSKQANLKKEIELNSLKKQKEIAIIEAKIKQIEIDLQQENDVRNQLGYPLNQNLNAQKLNEIKQLQTTIKNIHQETEGQKKVLLEEIKGILLTKTNQVKQQKKAIQFLSSSQKLHYYLAPTDGFIDKLNITEGEAIQPHFELFDITPKKPSFLIGFMPENVQLPTTTNQILYLKSVSRPQLTCKGKLIISGNKIIELPLRLRKFPEIKAYGKEVYIRLPSNNPFYKNEKIIIATKPF